MITGVNHLAFMTNDMDATTRFYRDLLGMELRVGIGSPGWRHYFFGFGDDHIAFFEYDGVAPMIKRPHGAPTREPLGFDHVALNVATREDLFALRDRLLAAGIEAAERNGRFRWGTAAMVTRTSSSPPPPARPTIPLGISTPARPASLPWRSAATASQPARKPDPKALSATPTTLNSRP